MNKSDQEQSGGSRYHVPNLERALHILEYLIDRPEGCGVSELARQLQVPKNSVFRIVKTLNAYDYLVFNELNKSYSLGRKFLALGHAAVGEQALLEKSLDIMRQLRDETKETVLMSTLIGSEGVVLESVVSSKPVKFTVDAGHRFPLHTAAPGKAMLAFLPEAQREAIIATMKFVKYTANTITSAKQYKAELAETAGKGYAVDDREEYEELRCVACPILNHRGTAIAALCVTAPAYRIKDEDIAKLAKQIGHSAGVISQRFGYNLITG